MEGTLLGADISRGILTNQSDRMLAKGRSGKADGKLGAGEELDPITRVGGWLSRILTITEPEAGPMEGARESLSERVWSVVRLEACSDLS